MQTSCDVSLLDQKDSRRLTADTIRASPAPQPSTKSGTAGLQNSHTRKCTRTRWSIEGAEPPAVLTFPLSWTSAITGLKAYWPWHQCPRWARRNFFCRISGSKSHLTKYHNDTSSLTDQTGPQTIPSLYPFISALNQLENPAGRCSISCIWLIAAWKPFSSVNLRPDDHSSSGQAPAHPPLSPSVRMFLRAAS